MANITVSDLYINGVKMPDPALEGVTISREKIWSENTGRTASGKMAGTIIGIKSKISIKWPVLTPAQVATIEGAVSDPDSPFVPVKYTDATGTTVTNNVLWHTQLHRLLLGKREAIYQRCQRRWH